MDEKQTKEAKAFRRNYEIFMANSRVFVGAVGILEDKQLTCPAKILFYTISSYSFKEGYCYATNDQLIEKLGLKLTMVKTYLAELKTAGLIDPKMVKTKWGIRRQIYIRFDVMRKKYLKKEDTKWKNPVRGRNPEDDRDFYPHPEDY